MRFILCSFKLILLFPFFSSCFAGQPLWTFKALDSTSKEVSANETVTIRYQVTNQSKRPHRFVLQPIPGVTGTFSGNGCPRVAGKNSGGNTTCLLTLTIDGSKLTEDINNGPLVCESGSMAQCYQPDAASKLKITRSTASSPGTLALYKDGLPLSSLNLIPLDSGAIEVRNIGQGPVANLSFTIPSFLTSYFTSHCGNSLPAGSSCFVNYTIPSPIAAFSNRVILVSAFNATPPSIKLPIKITVSGGLKCWGANRYGQLGRNSNIGNDNPNSTPQYVTNLGAGSNVVSVTGRAWHTCAMLDTGAMKCWGRNEYGQLGSTINSGNLNANPSPLNVLNLGAGSGVVSITAGLFHTCASLDTGAVKCWGRNLYGELGTTINSGTANVNNQPLDVETLGVDSGVVSVAAGYYHTCALLDTGAVKCWGRNYSGELGSEVNNGTNTPNIQPLDVQLDAGSRVVSMAVGGFHACVLLDTGEVKCWGTNFYGQLGFAANSGTGTPNLPQKANLPDGSVVVDIAAGTNYTCALLDNGAVYCWGMNDFGQLGLAFNSGTNNANNEPTVLPDLNVDSGVVSIAAASVHTCALLNTGVVKCWGRNFNGELGLNDNIGTNNPNDQPKDVQNLNGFVQGLFKLSSGMASCAIF